MIDDVTYTFLRCCVIDDDETSTCLEDCEDGNDRLGTIVEVHGHPVSLLKAVCVQVCGESVGKAEKRTVRQATVTCDEGDLVG
jgi:hypothetical protein